MATSRPRALAKSMVIRFDPSVGGCAARRPLNGQGIPGVIVVTIGEAYGITPRTLTRNELGAEPALSYRYHDAGTARRLTVACHRQSENLFRSQQELPMRIK